jgi:hypothetical protein
MEIGACAETEVYRRSGREGGKGLALVALRTLTQVRAGAGPSALFDRIFNIFYQSPDFQ